MQDLVIIHKNKMDTFSQDSKLFGCTNQVDVVKPTQPMKRHGDGMVIYIQCLRVGL